MPGEVLARLERAPLRASYLLVGADPFLVERGLGTLRGRLTEGVAERARVIWGDDDDERIASSLAELGAPALFGGVTVLIVRRAEALGTRMEEVVVDHLPRCGSGAHLVLVAKSLDQRRRLHAACAKAGAVVDCGRVSDTRAATAWVATLARERGNVLGPGVAEVLLERTGFDLSRIDDELEKLALAVGVGTSATADDVRRLVTGRRQFAIDELTERLARRDTGDAIRILRGLLQDGEAPLRVVGFVAANLRRRLHVTELREMGLGDDAIAARLSVPSWLVGRQGGGASPRDLEQALGVLAELDQTLKSSRPDAPAFEQAFLRLGRA